MNRIAFLLGKGIRDLWANKWEQGVTLVALTLLLFLGLMFILVVFNVRQQVLSRQGEMSFEVYWESSASLEQVKKQWKELKQEDLVQSISTYTPDEALGSLSQGLGNVDLDWLKTQNPLPPTALVQVRLPQSSPREAVQELVGHIEERPGVDEVSMNSEHLRRASTWTRLSERVYYPFLAGVIFLVALIMGNTFKLTLYSKREEVEVLRLVGAGRWFIQLPLFAGAVVQATVGGGLALLLLKIGQGSLNEALNVAPLWLELHFLPLQHIAAFFGVLVGVAILSSWVAIRDI
ncbi:MAG: permease-like cell division protein FtsX [Desulfohalobiaceae bacterium]|nr:permease-like cell division protein FtsX [Desulfohalobiaceae bacterium]